MAKPMVLRFEFERPRASSSSHRMMHALLQEFQNHPLGRHIVAFDVQRARLRVDVRWCKATLAELANVIPDGYWGISAENH